MLGLWLMSLLLIGLFVYAVVLYKSAGMDYKELILVFGSLLMVAAMLLYYLI